VTSFWRRPRLAHEGNESTRCVYDLEPIIPSVRRRCNFLLHPLSGLLSWPKLLMQWDSGQTGQMILFLRR
jgi:hypothetical protein